MSLTNILQEYFAQKKAIDLQDVLLENKVVPYIENCRSFISQLKKNVFENGFNNLKEEILFYKKIKPTIVADFIFYTKILKYHSILPFSSNSDIRNYFKDQVKEIRKHQKNLDFLYHYYHRKQTKLDTIYFVKTKQLDLFHVDLMSNFESDFFTYYSYNLCLIISNIKLLEFFREEKAKLKRNKLASKGKLHQSNLSWKGSKTDLVELIYSLKMSEVISGNNLTIKELVTLFSNLFQVEITNHYKIYSEIKNRVGPRSKFIDSLSKKFNDKLNAEDGL